MGTKVQTNSVFLLGNENKGLLVTLVNRMGWNLFISYVIMVTVRKEKR